MYKNDPNGRSKGTWYLKSYPSPNGMPRRSLIKSVEYGFIALGLAGVLGSFGAIILQEARVLPEYGERIASRDIEGFGGLAGLFSIGVMGVGLYSNSNRRKWERDDDGPLGE